MKKIQFIIVTAILSIVGMTSAKAQNYLLDYGPGSIPWCMQMDQQINAMRAQNAAMQAQILSYYQQQAAAATQHLTANGDPAADTGFVAHSDLTQIQPAAERVRKLLDQFPEIHPAVGGKLNGNKFAVK